ncbi:MAG: dethiobiotin synthase [Betaproteobacteria bacterium]|nr:dethiobiotin synthase [Betaproteobacteria bacterium]MBE8190107.1 dethiobiotin synthase [Candidatus Thioglobus sp.]
MKGLFISGSGTDVGKTFIAERIIKALNGQFRVVARKPIESDCLPSASGLLPKDADLLNQACARPEPLAAVCKYRFEACVSGEKASSAAGISLTLNDLLAASKPKNTDDFVILEGAGGLYSPLATQLLNADLAAALALPLVLVVKDELGAINQALLSLRAAKEHNLRVLLLVLNQISPNNLDNATALKAYSDVEVAVFNQNCSQEFAAKVQKLLG